jgi:hypothetical protein
MKTLSSVVVVALAACGGSSKPEAVSGRTEPGTVSMAPLDGVMADLEAMRPYVVVKDGNVDCTAYTAQASALVTKLAGGTPQANSARTSASPDVVAAWQRAHASAIEKLLTDVVTPVRNQTACEPMQKDQTWHHVSFALVAVAQPAQPPAPVLERRALMEELLAASEKMASADDCKRVMQEMMTKHPQLDQAFKAMSPIDKFIDDKVWEEDEEAKAKADPRFQKLGEHCGF